MKISELKQKNSDELKTLLIQSKKELMNLRFQLVSGAMTKTSVIPDVKKRIARILTILNTQSLGEKNA